MSADGLFVTDWCSGRASEKYYRRLWSSQLSEAKLSESVTGSSQADMRIPIFEIDHCFLPLFRRVVFLDQFLLSM
jgi:hypothetical protein